MPDLDGNGVVDPWEPHWIDDPHPDDKAALQTTFAGIHPETLIQHDLPADQSAALGLPAGGVEQAQATAPVADPNVPAQSAPPVEEQDWNPAFTQGPAPEVTPAPNLSFAQPGLGGIPTQGLEQAAQSTEEGENLYADDPLNDPDRERGMAVLDGIRQRNPVHYAEIVSDFETARTLKTAADMRRAAEDDERAAQANLKVRKDAEAATAKKVEALNAQATELANRKIDPDRYMSNRSFGRVLLDMLGGAIGGYVATQTRGPNPYIAGMNQRIDRDIDAQKQEIENGRTALGMKKSILADEYARTGDLYQSTEAVRIATKTAVRDKILADQQLYDPKGTQFLARGRAAAEMTSAIQAGQQKHAQTELENRLKVGKLQLDAMAERRAREKDANELALKKAKGVGSGKTKPRPETPVYTAWLAEKHIEDGPAARAAFQEHLANARRAQATWDAAPKGASAVVGGVAGGGTAQSDASASIATTASAGAPAQKYTSPQDWFETFGPGLGPEERKRFWFVDGNNGNDTPPIRIESIEDPEKFGKRQRIRNQMGIKATKLLHLTERLQKRGLWSKTKNAFSWSEDADAMEARALSENLKGDVLVAKEMGVPSGTDIERITTMMGGDPASWKKDPTPALQSMRETMQDEQNADWNVNAPSAAKDSRYNQYRVIPTIETADPGWVKKFNARGVIKELAPEMANTDPRSLTAKPVEGDAPNVEGSKAGADYTRNLAHATDWIEAGGFAPSADADIGAAQLGVGTSSKAKDTPQANDFPYKGEPEGSDAFLELRKNYVMSFPNLMKYQQTHDPKDWKGFQDNQKDITSALSSLITLDDIPPKQRTTWKNDPSLVAHLAGVVLRRGGKR